jgi:undecaprenyl-diphosphatase
LTTIAFAVSKRRFEALLVAGSAVGGALLIYFVKMMTNRARPALWETQWYWGTSFPSGHTLETACVGMAIAICMGRMWPKGRLYFRAGALVWAGLVGLSRLVLGVHWPTDVMVAGCVGILVPVAVRLALMVTIARPGEGSRAS